MVAVTLRVDACRSSRPQYPGSCVCEMPVAPIIKSRAGVGGRAGTRKIARLRRSNHRDFALGQQHAEAIVACGTGLFHHGIAEPEPTGSLRLTILDSSPMLLERFLTGWGHATQQN
jgi:hypothetical protein